jgi:hypothetical protein
MDLPAGFRRSLDNTARTLCAQGQAPLGFQRHPELIKDRIQQRPELLPWRLCG